MFYSRNHRVIAFPCLMYLSAMGTFFSSPRTVVALEVNFDNTVMGILMACPSTNQIMHNSWSNLSFYSISLSLNIILTLMIVIRLVLYGRNNFAATKSGSPTGLSRLYRTIATMLIESCALYAASSLSLIVPWALGSPVTFLFAPIFAVVQVRAFPPLRYLTGCLT